MGVRLSDQLCSPRLTDQLADHGDGVSESHQRGRQSIMAPLQFDGLSITRAEGALVASIEPGCHRGGLRTPEPPSRPDRSTWRSAGAAPGAFMARPLGTIGIP